jgi:hypothetical protein
MEMGCFLCAPCRNVKGTKSVNTSVEFHTGGREDRTLACEAEESPLLEATAREWLVKKQQAGKEVVNKSNIQSKTLSTGTHTLDNSLARTHIN